MAEAAENQEIEEVIDEPVVEQPTDEPPKEEPKVDDEPPKKGAAERIQELVAERNATTEYAEYWRKRALENIEPPKAEPSADKAPELADFDFDANKWAAAYTDWSDKRIEAKAQDIVKRQLGEARTQESVHQARQAYQERVAAFTEKHPDFHAVIGNRQLPITDSMTEVILSSEKGPDIAYHLGNNPAEAARISRLGPTQQAAALGRIEATLDNPAPTKKRTSNAPEPPTPITGGGSPGVNLETCSLDDYLAHRLGKKK